MARKLGLQVGIKELRDGLSRYLDRVRAGGTITVTDHGRPIARIRPVGRLTNYEQMKLDGRIAPARVPERHDAAARARRDHGRRVADGVHRRAAPVIGYVDTSAFIPLLAAEPTSPACAEFWRTADAVVSCRIVYAETAAALAGIERSGRLTAAAHRRARAVMDALYVEFEIVDIRTVPATTNSLARWGWRVSSRRG